MGTPDRPADGAGTGTEIRTFLIADVRGYTLFTHQRGDEAAAKLAARFADLARHAIETRGGSLVELRGDEALAIFGSARQAIRAAVELQQRFMEETASEPDLPLPVGIGLDAGEAVPVEEGYRGGALNLAARLCGRAGPGEILASREVTHLARKVDGVRYRDVGTVRLKGLTDPVGVVRVVSEERDPMAFFAEEGRRASTRNGADRPRRLRVGVAVAVAALIALVAAIAIPIATRPSRPLVLDANEAGVVDASTGRVVAAVHVGNGPVALAAGGGFVWVANADDDSVSKIDATTRTVVDTIQVGNGPTAVAFGAGALWVTAAADRRLDQVDPATGRVVRRIRIGQGAAAVAVADGVVWVADSADNQVLRIDAAKGVVLGHPIAVGASPSAIAAGSSIWVANSAENTVSRLSPDTGAVISTRGVGNEPRALAIAPSGVWVANQLDGTVSRIDPSTGTVEATVPVGPGPSGIAVAGGSVWVTNRFGHTLTRIDATANPAPHDVRVGAGPIAAVAMGKDVWTVVQGGAAHRGGTLRVVGSDPFTIETASVYTLAGWQIVALTNDGLVGFERTGGLQGSTIVPDLATSLPTPTDGGRTYTFTLRTGIRYSTGAPVRPEDFRTAIERSFQGALGAAFYTDIVGAERCTSGKHCDLSNGIFTDDAADTVTFHLARPDPLFLDQLAIPGAFPVPAGTPVDDERTHPVPATGPYMIASYVPGERMELVRNPYFSPWSVAAQPDGFPDRIDFAFDGKAEGQVAAIERGAADVLTDTPPADMLSDLMVRHPAQVHTYQTPSTYYLWLNTRTPPFDNVLARRAVNFAVDRTPIVKTLGGKLLAQPTCQILPPVTVGYEPYCPYTTHPRNGSWHGPDMAEARALVRRSGTARTPVVILWFEGEEWATRAGPYLAALLDALGYRASVRPVGDYDTWIRETGSANVQSGLDGWIADYPAPSEFLDVLLSCSAYDPHADASLNEARFCDRGVQRAIDRALEAQSVAPADAPRLWAQADRAMTDAAPWVPLANGSGVDFVSARVGNYQRNPQWGVLLDQLWVR